MQKKQNFTWWLDISLLTFIVGALQFLMLGDRPLFVPDEGRYAEIAREMANSGDFITPFLNHIKYFEKPPLFYWMAAVAIKIGGANIWAVRSINALIAIIGCLATYTTTRLLYDRTTALIASMVLATSTLYFVMSHMVSLDLPVTVFISLCFYCFLLAIKRLPGNSRRFLMWGCALFAGLAVLTKGLIGIVFPALIIFSWLAVLGNWRLLKQLYLPSSILIFLIVTLPWHILVQLQNPEFFDFYIIEQHFLRYLDPNVGHYQPSWFFFTVILAAFFPWVVFMLQSYANAIPLHWKERHQQPTRLFLFLWVTIIFAFFSLSKSKLIPYILPVIPPLAILTALFLKQTMAQSSKWLKLGYGLFVLGAIAIAIVFYQFSHHTALPDPLHARKWLGIASSILVIGSLLAFCYSYFSHRHALIITIATSYLFLLSFLAAGPSIDTRSIQPLAEKIRPMLNSSDEVICYNQYYQDLPFYLQRRVSILNWQNELGFGMQHQDTNSWMIDNRTFWLKWRGKRTIFVFMDKEEYDYFKSKYPKVKVYQIAETINNIVITNHPRNNPT